MKKIESEKEFNEVIQGDYVVVKFGAPWCGPCKLIEPQLEQLSADGYSVYALNIDDISQPAIDYAVMSIPVTFVFNKGKALGRVAGFKTKDELIEFVEGAKG
jgi:thioredoxin 1